MCTRMRILEFVYSQIMTVSTRILCCCVHKTPEQGAVPAHLAANRAEDAWGLRSNATTYCVNAIAAVRGVGIAGSSCQYLLKLFT